MLILIAKLLVIIGLPVVTAIVWQRRTQASWACLPIAFGTVAIIFLVRIPLDAVLLDLDYALAIFGHPDTSGILPRLIILNGLTYGLLREGIRWLMLRPVATIVRSWEEGVLFGIVYSIAATLTVFGDRVAGQIEPWGDLYAYFAIISAVNDFYSWGIVLVNAWYYGPPEMVFNVGTSLAVLLSIRRRQVWPLFIAVLFYTVFLVAPFVAAYIIDSLNWIIVSLGWTGISYRWSGYVNHNLGLILSALLYLWFIIWIRKRMDKTPSGQTPQTPQRDSLDGQKKDKARETNG